MHPSFTSGRTLRWLFTAATLLLTVALNSAIQFVTGFDMYSLTLWVAVPAGATILALCSVIGFAFGARRFGREADHLDLFYLMVICIALQVLVVAVPYLRLQWSGAMPQRASLPFFSYFLQSMTSGQYIVYSHQFGVSAPKQIGEFGWLLFFPRMGCSLAMAKFVHSMFAPKKGYAAGGSYDRYRRMDL